MYQNWPKTADITNLPALTKEKIAKCMFTAYQDGASGVTKHYQTLLTETFVKLMDEFKSKITKIYTTEEYYLPMERTITTCGLGIEDDGGRIYLYKAIIRHENNQCGQPGNPCPIPPL